MVSEEGEKSNLPGRISRTSVIRDSRQSIAESPSQEIDHFDSNSLIGKVLFDEYLIKDVIGHGGMAVVYQALSKSTGETVAIKTLKYADATLMQRFIREIEIHKNLSHPNIVKAIDFKTTSDGRAFFVMELLMGRSIEDLFATKVRFTKPDRIKGIVYAVCDALSAAHAQGIIHRDIKPGNIIISKQAGSEKVSVVDFGLAKLYEDLQRITKTGQVLGSPVYMSPEQCLGEDLDPRSDVYSLAVVLYEMVTGELPYNAVTPVAMMEAHCNPSIHPIPVHEVVPDFACAEELSLILRKAMETELADRFQTVNEFKEAFTAWYDYYKTGEDNDYFSRPEYQKYLNEDSGNGGPPSDTNQSSGTSSNVATGPSKASAFESKFYRSHSARGFDGNPGDNTNFEQAQKPDSMSSSATASAPLTSQLDSLVSKTREGELKKRSEEFHDDSSKQIENSAKLKKFALSALLFIVLVTVFAGGTIWFCIWYYKL